MTARPLNAVLRALADTGPPDTDADLLRRFVATRDDEAFAALVKRHGRLVWAVCRHLTNSDTEADDAFQATFLVLVRNAGRVKDAAKLSAWLHGVAYKVCGKSRQAAKRRTTREQATAARERNGHAVPDSAWDRALSAVHEEVAGLPDSLRVPFVLCCLEGKGQTEAAEQLGWKLGTLSGRLTRAKDAVLAKLSARGLTLGVLASVGLTSIPSDVSAKAVGLIGSVISGSVLQLSSGVIGMSVHKVKLLAAGVLAACGVAISGGSGWVATAEGQSGGPPAKASPADKVKQLEADLVKAKAEAAKAEAEAVRATAERVTLNALQKAADAKMKADEEVAKVVEEVVKVAKPPKVADDASAATKKNDYLFVAVSSMDKTKFVEMLQKREDAGWSFSGTAPIDDKPMWVFRRSKGTQYTTITEMIPAGTKYSVVPVTPATVPETPGKPLTSPRPAEVPVPPTPVAPTAPAAPVTPAATVPGLSTPDDADAIEAEIKRLQEKLDKLKKGKKK